jgi:DNA-binding LacI/PurR family transcriptional regulator
MRSATIEDVARGAGGSIATVSRVLAGNTNVKAATRNRVLAEVARVHYRPSRVARTLRSQRAATIGLIISDIQNPFFTAMVRAIEDIAYQHNYSLVLCNSDEDPEKEALYIDLLLAEQVAGIIIACTVEVDVAHQRLHAAQIPVVAIDRRMGDYAVDTVLVDSGQASYEVVCHLIEQGHRRIGALIGVPGVTTGRERQEGYLRALADHNIPFAPELLQAGIPKIETGSAFTAHLLALSDPPTALFTGNNLLTIGALRTIHEAGLRIPQDIAIVAFDEMEWMFLMQPPLTVVAQPTYEMGQKAAERLLLRLANPDLPPIEIILPPTIHIRGSSQYMIECKS